MIGIQSQGEGGSCQSHTQCRVCSWKASLQLGLGGEAELPLCHSWHGQGIELTCTLDRIKNKIVQPVFISQSIVLQVFIVGSYPPLSSSSFVTTNIIILYL